MPDAQPATPTATPGTQPPAAPAKPPEPKRDPMARTQAALLQETKRLAQEKQDFAAARAKTDADLAAREKALTDRVAALEAFEKRSKGFKENPEELFRSYLGDEWYDRATEIRLSGKAPPDMQLQAVRDEAKAEAERLRKENDERWAKLDEEKKANAEAAKKAIQEEQQRNIAAFEAEAVAFVKKNPDKYELINLNEVWSYVPQVIRQNFAQNGKLLEAEEAADLVEAKLEELEEKKIKVSKKLRAKWETVGAQPPASEVAPGARTLTNEGGAVPGAPSTTATSDDRYARAAAAYDAVIAKQRARQGT